ncbi:hypothetical protein [Gordoniibacillus kamchatkensis]|uniref:hypothetical protein n=1 Tax=Gordoniibacillus kamchatkensis TaxID=1590651 RepID=UPI0012E06673|nr:hypothetical protein [Paenibacillus sp. VKM B-2647]
MIGAPDRVVSIPKEHALSALGVMGWAMSISQRTSGRKAMRLLGWQPRRRTLLQDLAQGDY